MDYFEALKTSEKQDFYAHSPVPPPKDKSIGSVIKYIKETCDDLYFTSDTDEPVELYQLSAAGLHMLESGADKLSLPNAQQFAGFVAGAVTPLEDEFVAEKSPTEQFFKRLVNQQVSERQKRLGVSLQHMFEKLVGEPGTEAAYYRVGFPKHIEVYVVVLYDGQVIGLKTVSVET